MLQAEIREKTAMAELAEIDLAQTQEKERDRLAGSGYNRVLNLNEPLIGEIVDAYIGALEHWERRSYDNDRPIQININSPGGSVMDGLALYDTIMRLRRKGIKIITRGTGLVASMATIILMAGDERVADKNAQILVHELSSGARGKISGIKDEAAMMERLNQRLLNILAERASLSKDEIFDRVDRREWWIDAEEALEYGFIDRIE